MGYNSILRPTFRSVFNGTELFRPSLLLATLANMQKYRAALDFCCTKEKKIPNGKHAKTAETG